MQKWFGLRCFLAAAALLAFPAPELSAQGVEPARITGVVTDENGSPMAGVQIVIVNQQTGFQSGALTQANGRYLVMGLRAGGPYRIEARMIGYGLEAVDDLVLEAGGTFEANFSLGTEAIALDALEVFSTRAIERKTPVAFTDVDKVQIVNQLGSRDLPMVLNVTPSVYATQQGGGAGDARINVRGFNQQNTAIMINGVPVNDMENGWVYWSNWDGVGDAAKSVQLQRGLSAVNLATPSIGGTMNIITDPTQMGSGVSWKQEFGSGGFLKETVSFATGEFSNRYAFSGSVVRKTADGFYDGGRFSTNEFGGDAAWTDAWAYYVAGSFQVNPKNRLEFYAVGAPQRHGQNSYKLNIGTLSHSFAKSLDSYDEAALGRYEEAGLQWSPNVNRVSSSYTGNQYNSTGPGSGTSARHDSGFINERENYFHKPQVNLNWYSYFGNNLTLSTVGYYSGGKGGGSGTYGSSSGAAWNYQYYQRVPDWDGTIEKNQARTDGSSGYLLRNSVNNQNTFGVISKLRKDFDGGITGEIGLDWRTATIEHYREVRDLLGGQWYDDSYYGSDFWAPGEEIRRLGDKVNYDNENTVDWLGAFVQAERSNQNGSVYGMLGWAQNSYNFTDFWNDDPDKTGLQHLKLNSGNINGYQIKGGASRNVTEEITLFVNGGYVSKVPIFDGVIDDGAGVINPDPKNEKFTSFEGGMTYRSEDRALSFDLSAYYTKWEDRTNNVFVRNLTGDNQDGLVSLLGLDARHMGIEAFGGYQPNDLLRIDVAASLGNWEYLNDVTGTYKPDGSGSGSESFEFYLEGLKVADAPQSQLAYAISLFPVQDLYIRGQGRTYWNYFAQFDPLDRTQASEAGIQSWKTPGYTILDLHASYRLGDLIPVWQGGDVRLFLNAFNVLDNTYISDAVDNSSYNGWDGDHDADDAEVFLGQPRYFNLGFEIKF
jgi:iron complex outermembrane receptor protein